MALSSFFGLSLDGVENEFLELLYFLLIHRGKTLESVVREAADVLFLKLGDVVHQRIDRLTAGEQGTDRRVDSLVRYWDAQHLVASGHHTKSMVDKQIAAHQFVD